ncbi:hypothetical protein Tco_0833203, partial [Tanacetum coccineum]
PTPPPQSSPSSPSQPPPPHYQPHHLLTTQRPARLRWVKLAPAEDKLNWNNPEGDCYPFYLSKPLPLQGPRGHRIVAADYFFNNDLEYLKTSDLKITYTTSITKTKEARYEIKGIEDMVILGVKSVSVKKLLGYGHLEEIVVKRSNQQLHKFKEGDFVDLHLKDIEDILLLVVQYKLFHLDGSDIVDFIMALRMFTRSLILKRHVEDLQLGVESYQKKLNITKPQKTFPKIKSKEPYTPSYDPPKIFYEDLNKQKRVLRADELYKLSDGTLKSVRYEIHRRVLDFRLDYNTEMPKRKWMTVDRKRSGLMIELINKQLREREIIRNSGVIGFEPSINDTVPNALLCVNDSTAVGKQKFRPAYMLSDERSKRAGRARRLSSSDINGKKSRDPHQTRVLTASSVVVKAAHDNETLFNIMSLKTPMELSIDEKQQVTNSVPYYLDEATGWGLEIC